MKIEGRLAGPYVGELQQYWNSLSRSSGKQVLVDLTEATLIDPSGIELLAHIYAETGADLLANSPFTEYFVEQVKRNRSSNGSNKGED